ncbi:predicted protein [Plenodomus lingam JN3]|uniref:Predicted protein n=1 Tax=Leptosphaeria maculans (strain JN3 / isolate v23.1.3 / race Av1-4-5-6-7-8) TaxID=985895 RepID=E4ZMY6_LEPMJ|nr:predicted protein [Plenodomus lingam JN3]CBX92589.1 predicted protein [Plenodomus lingam JN3]
MQAGLLRALHSHPTTHKYRRLLIERGERVSRSVSNHCILAPRRCMKPKPETCIGGRPRHALALSPSIA